jgi:riboflavin synthase
VFTGLVQELGQLLGKRPLAAGARLRVASTLGNAIPYVLGESIAVDGACLSAVAWDAQSFEVDASAETLSRTTLGSARVGDTLHIERAARFGDPIGGHLVTGHVDGLGTLESRDLLGEAQRLRFRAPAALAPMIAEKGSICVAGVSLTVNEVDNETFNVVIIPLTQSQTKLGSVAVGTALNLEVDLIARYVARLHQFGKTDWTTLLGQSGYL